MCNDALLGHGFKNTVLINKIYINVDMQKLKTQNAIERSTQIISEKGGRILDTVKSNNGKDNLFKIICKNNHIWTATHQTIARNGFCKQCHLQKISANRQNKLSKLMLEKDAKILIENGEIITVQCSENHIWETKKRYVLQNNWCALCSKSKSEEFCRAYFEKLFEEKFPTKRIFKSPETGALLELDGYCEKLGIAFEYNGIQHYRKQFKKQDFEKTKRYDLYKKELCEKHGIKLFIIPTFFSLLNVSDLESFVLENCKALKININNVGIDLNSLNVNSKNNKTFSAIKENINKSNCLCLTQFYINSIQNIEIKCKNGHIFHRQAANLLKNKPKCFKCRQYEKITKPTHENAPKLPE